jgi:hypothetical protein
MDNPTIGRRLWYWPLPNERTIPESAQPFDAGVAYVHSPTLVNITIANEFGNPMPGKQSVTLVAAPADAQPGQVSWMQYHVEQTAKTEHQPGPITLEGGESLAAGLSD